MEYLKNSLDAYIKRTYEIRALSGAGANGAGSASDYIKELKSRHKRISMLASENKKMLDEVLYPILSSEELLEEETADALFDFCSFLLNPWPMEDLDLSLLFQVLERLIADAEAKQDDDTIVGRLTFFIYATYNNMNRANRIQIPENEVVSYYQSAGLKAADKILKYLEHDSFLKLKDPKRRMEVIGQARFYLALYDTWYTTDEATNDFRIDGLIRSLDFANDPFYLENTGDIDWDRYALRSLEHMGQLTENGNKWDLTPDQCKKINSHMKQLKDLWYKNPEKSSEILPEVQLKLILARNEYYCGGTTSAEYRKELIKLYRTYATSDYDMYSVMTNIFIPAEYMTAVTGEPDQETKSELLEMYYGISSFLLHAQGEGAVSFLMEYLAAFLDHFIEIPKEYSFEKICANCMVALHPPTFAHSLQVASISRCLCKAMLRNNPAYFIGDGSFDFEDDTDLVSLVYHAGICHDFGKLYIIDTINVYGRDLTETEHSLIRLHALQSRKMLGRYDSTKRYARIAGVHHAAYDNETGYPHEHGNVSDTELAIAHLIAVADSIDAGTDAVGRSYRKNKSFSAIVKEIKSLSGTRYDPAVVRLLDDDEVIEEIRSILNNRRKKNYGRAFEIICDIRSRAPYNIRARLEELVKQTLRIRNLLCPDISDVDDGDSYGQLIRRNYAEIATLSMENREILEEVLYPMLAVDKPMSSDDISILYDLCEELINGQQLGDLDCRLLYIISKRLLREAGHGKDPLLTIRQLDMHIVACYELSHQTKRMKAATDLLEEYRLEGLSVSQRLLDYLAPESFSKIIDREMKYKILMHSRYDSIMYEKNGCIPELNEKSLSMLIRSYKLSKDPFYRKNAPDYTWDYHTIRALEYIGQETEVANDRGFDEAKLNVIADLMAELRDYWNRDPAKHEEYLPHPVVELLYQRNMWLAKRTDTPAYRNELIKIYETAEPGKYDFYNVILNLLVPVEFVTSFEKENSVPDEETEKKLNSIYANALAYVFGSMKSTTFDLVLEYYSELLYHFRETEDMSFEDMCLKSMAALHPPTYVHSVTVGNISRMLTGYLIEKTPGAFAGCLGLKNSSDVKDSAQMLNDFAYHAARCHDVGKLPMIDTISVYGRKLMDSEHNLLIFHPVTGQELLEHYDTTRQYADVALRHHIWYDGGKGYPEPVGLHNSSNRIFADIVSIADSLDAATDTVGRNYNRGKTYTQVFNEIQRESGTRYSPVVASVLGNEDVRNRISEIIEDGRRSAYREIFSLMSDLCSPGRKRM